MKKPNTYKYSENFFSFQGEGFYTGRATAWIRFFLCNLQCDGFGQKDPTDPSTYILPYKDFDVSTVSSVEDLPVFEYGCDSSYTWAKKYKHLMHNDDVITICNNIQNAFKHQSNPTGMFKHPITNQDTHMAFTGGEPMLNQEAMFSIMMEFARRGNYPRYVTVETNGTKPFNKSSRLAQHIKNEFYSANGVGREWFWSVSPKLWSTAGEKPEKAICPEVIQQYAEVSNNGQLKYVVNGTPESWTEVEKNTQSFRNVGIDWDVYIMGIGATKESQEDGLVADIAMEAIKRGYHFSGRLHCSVMGNKIGT